MDTEKLKKKVESAKEAVKDLDEPLKTKAFEIILNKLLNVKPTFEAPVMTSTAGTAIPEPIYEEDVADKLSNLIDSTAYPIMFNFSNARDKSLYTLFIAKNDDDVDDLTPSHISKILTVKFRISTSTNAISMALMKAGSLVDRRQINTAGGAAYEYRIMHAGEKYVQSRLQNPPDKVKTTKTTSKKKSPSFNQKKSKKPKMGLKDRILELKEEGYFESPKEVMEVKDELEIRGFHYNRDPVGVALLRLVKKRTLRRIKDIKEKKNIYRYCNY